MIPLCCGFLIAIGPEREPTASSFFKNISLLMLCEEMILWRGANTKHCHSFFFSHLLCVQSSPLSFTISFTLLSRPSFLSDNPKLPFCSRKQISCKRSPFDFFFCTSWGKFPRKLVSFVAKDLSGSHWSAGNREHKGLRACFK